MAHKFWNQLDTANDEKDVRRRIAEGLYNQPHLGIAEEWLRRKDEIRANNRQNELLTKLKAPHWSTTPLFWVSVVAMAAACIAAYFSVFSPQSHESATSSQKVQKEQPTAGNSSSNSHTQLESALLPQQQ